MTIFYDQALSLDLEKTAIKSERYLKMWVGFVTSNLKAKKVRILELGAGSCVTGLLAARELLNNGFDVNYMAVDYDLEKLQLLYNDSYDLILSSRASFGEFIGSYTTANFDDPTQISKLGEFDLIIYDAAFHHIRNVSRHLNEVAEILDEEGFLVLQREQFLRPYYFGEGLRQERFWQVMKLSLGNLRWFMIGCNIFTHEYAWI